MSEEEVVAEPRLKPLPPEHWDDDVLAALRGAFPARVVEQFRSATAPSAAVTTLLHTPALAGPWLVYNNQLLWNSTLDDRSRELMILRVAWRTGSNYEWVQHVKLGSRFGITRDDLDAIRLGDPARHWTRLETALVAATDQLLDDYRIDDATWARLTTELDGRQLVELVFVVGSYTCLAMAFESFGLQLEPGTDTTEAEPLPA